MQQRLMGSMGWQGPSHERKKNKLQHQARHDGLPGVHSLLPSRSVQVVSLDVMQCGAKPAPLSNTIVPQDTPVCL